MPESIPPPNLDEQFVAESVPIGLPWRLLVFSLVILGFTTSVYFGLRFGYSTYLDQQSKSVDKKINELASKVKQEDQKSFINFYSQLINLKRVLDGHAFSSNIFSFLERNTLESVYYVNSEFLVNNNSLDLRGEAISSEALVGQLGVFDKAPELEEVLLSQMGFGSRTGTVSFEIALTFKPDFFSRPQ